MRLTSPDPAATLDDRPRLLRRPGRSRGPAATAPSWSRGWSRTQPLAAVLDPVPGKVPAWRDRDELRAWVRDRVATTFHPSSTCRMGPAADPGAVVDHAGRVHGIAGLRVADASVFPTIPRANIHCTVVAVAEKLADAIRRDVPA